VEEQPHGLQDGDLVRFEDVDGMAPLCDGRTFSVRVTGRHRVRIGDTRGLGTYAGGGRMIEVKQPREVQFVSLAEALEAPPLHECAGVSRERALTIHACFCALSEMPTAPSPGSEDGARALLDAVTRGGLVPEERLQHEVVRAFARGAAGSLAPVASCVGGIAAQEVLKACSAKFSPLRQFLYLDCLDALPSPLPSEAECAPRGDRYDGQRAVLGDRVQRALAEMRLFVVGAGGVNRRDKLPR